MVNHFELFELPQQFALDAGALEQAYRQAQSVIHPDRYAHAGETERRLAVQMSAQVNEAYRTLKSPVERARYLLSLQGHDAFDESDTHMPGEFLLAQMERREALGEARGAGDVEDLERLAHEVSEECAALDLRIAEAIDVHQAWGEARTLVRQRKFLDKLVADLHDAIAAVEG